MNKRLKFDELNSLINLFVDFISMLFSANGYEIKTFCEFLITFFIVSSVEITINHIWTN